MTISRGAPVESAERIAGERIGVLVEKHPELLPVLSRHGLDLCCGGGHTVAEAAQLHELDLDALVREIDAAIGSGRR
jgi:iron-sulfur cluster repair protein YtfE (RIC family)